MKRRDPAQRLRVTRGRRDKGIRVYIDAQSLRRSGIPDNGTDIYYRLWGTPGGSVLVRLYLEP